MSYRSLEEPLDLAGIGRVHSLLLDLFALVRCERTMPDEETYPLGLLLKQINDCNSG